MLNTIFFFALMATVTGVPFYFNYRFQNTAKTQRNTSAINSLAAKLSVFIIVALYSMSFLALQIKNAAYSKVGFCACIFSFFLLYSFRGKMIHEVREIPADPRERFQRSLRTIVAMGLLYGIYFATVQFLIPHTGIFPAVGIALIFITYATPLFVRVWMPTQRMHPSTIKEDILAVFRSAGSPIHEIYLIDTDRFKSYNALVCGPKFGFGPFQRSLFITKNLFEVMEPEEIHAVVCHEASHFKLHHVAKRGFMSLVGLFVGMFTVILPMGFISILMNITLYKNFGLTIFTTLACITVQMSFLYRVIRKQEFEADLEALNLGARPAALITALEKITEKNGMSRVKEDRLSRFMFGHAHPSTDERIAAIQNARLPQDSRIFPSWKVGTAYASFVFALGTFAVVSMSTTNTPTGTPTGQRLPAADNTVNAQEVKSEK